MHGQPHPLHVLEERLPQHILAVLWRAGRVSQQEVTAVRLDQVPLQHGDGRANTLLSAVSLSVLRKKECVWGGGGGI